MPGVTFHTTAVESYRGKMKSFLHRQFQVLCWRYVNHYYHCFEIGTVKCSYSGSEWFRWTRTSESYHTYGGFTLHDWVLQYHSYQISKISFCPFHLCSFGRLISIAHKNETNVRLKQSIPTHFLRYIPPLRIS